ncbi:MAG: RipA family octameric membrane protein [Pseudonocardiaceae bacterium]
MSDSPRGERQAGSGRANRFLDTYFRTAGSPALDTVRSTLWTSGVPPAWDEQDPAYRTAVLEQYKIYVEMADRISNRRGLTNTFFLTLNTVIFTAIGIFWQHPPEASRGVLTVLWLVLLGQCLAWFWLLRSYRQLNTAKYAVIGALEERLPASPYWGAEWAALGYGRDPARYWPLSHVEQWIPSLFALAYTAGFLAMLVT